MTLQWTVVSFLSFFFLVASICWNSLFFCVPRGTFFLKTGCHFGKKKVDEPRRWHTEVAEVA